MKSFVSTSFAGFVFGSILSAPLFAVDVDPARLPPPASTPVDFATDIKPLLETSCLKCHQEEKPKGNYRLTTRANALKEGENGINILPGESARSPLIHYVARTVEELEMPPEGKGTPLTAAQTGMLRAWIDQGVKWPENVVLHAPLEKDAPLASAHTLKPSRPAVVTLPPPSVAKVDFVKDIQPLLAQSCYSCHGAERQKGELRWDMKRAALQGGESGPPIIPGNSAESLMIQLVAGMKGDVVMPQKGERLTPEQIGVLRAWIDQGAHWPEGVDPVKFVDKRDHWSFKAAGRPAIPLVENERWPRNAVDRFVLARLEKEKLSPSPEADRRLLIRRLSLDLIGLPPTLEEIDQFLADQSPEAYGTLVERLLASPHYGERWGRHWLDAARYADTNGYEKDAPRSIWPYRDWVINAFNRDLPFNQFTIEQIAGDLLPGATLDQKVATGFLRNSMLNEEGGVDPEQFRIEGLIDRVDTIGKSFLGLTLNCAQCHNHKYDPISQREYYEFMSFLNDDIEPEMEVPSEPELAKRADILRRIAAIEDGLVASDAGLPQRLEEWEREVMKPPIEWTLLPPDSWFAANGGKFEKLEDGSLLAKGDKVGEASYSYTAKTDLKNLTAFRVEVLTDPTLPRTGPGRSSTGNMVLTEFSITATPVTDSKAITKVEIASASADYAQPGFPPEKSLDGDPKSGWGVDAGPGGNRDHHIVFETKTPVGFDDGTVLTFNLVQKFGTVHAIGRYRILGTAAPTPVRADPVPARIRTLLAVPAAERTAAQKREIFSHYRTLDPKFTEANKAIAEARKEWPLPPTTMVLMERQPRRVQHIFKRGDFRKSGEAVTAAVPAVLHPLPEGEPRNRLGLARWLAAADNPLTARVAVNRAWQAYFGRGLVPTTEDLGTQGELPSHPELLDWLALDFVENGWSMKRLHRRIVTSATYRQESKVSPELYARDQYNQLLARGPRQRVEAEVVRDIALSVSGLLSRKIGGPSVYPPIPDGVLNLGYGAAMPWPTSTGEDRYRRGMYTFWKRSVPYPGASIFDAPNGDFSCVRRIRSNTPLQALTTLNDTVFHEAAQALALRVYKDGGADDSARAHYAFRLCVGREPDAVERGAVDALLKQEKDYFAERTAAAVTVATADPKSPPADVNLHNVAAWTMVSRVLLNLDETITKE